MQTREPQSLAGASLAAAVIIAGPGIERTYIGASMLDPDKTTGSGVRGARSLIAQ